MKYKQAARRAKSVLVTAGPTREKIDPIRFISNYSTGTFGYEIAGEARRMGLGVTLVSGPTALKRPRGVRFFGVESACEMRDVVKREFKSHDCIIMAAAVSDWRPRKVSRDKIKRRPGRFALELRENPDILREVCKGKGPRIAVGFALETRALEKGAARKLKEKNLDIVVANRLGPGSPVFGDDRASVLIIDRFGRTVRLKDRSKRELAKIILDKVLNYNI